MPGIPGFGRLRDAGSVYFCFVTTCGFSTDPSFLRQCQYSAFMIVAQEANNLYVKIGCSSGVGGLKGMDQERGPSSKFVVRSENDNQGDG